RHDRQNVSRTRQRATVRTAGEPCGEDRVDAVARPGPLAVRTEKIFLVVADDDLGVVFLQRAHDRVRKTVFVDAVAEADQRLDIPHQSKRLRQPGRVAMNVRYDAEPPEPAPLLD